MSLVYYANRALMSFDHAIAFVSVLVITDVCTFRHYVLCNVLIVLMVASLFLYRVFLVV